MPKVSVVMASFNHASFVREAIESVLTQSWQDIELVITDDGSTDDTVAVIRGVTDPRIRLVVLPQNQGACVALNDAITRATGEYVAVLNSDDFFLPGKLERQVAFLDGHANVGAVFGLPQFVDERGRRFQNAGHAFSELFVADNAPRQEWLRRFFFEGNCLCHPTILIRKSCYTSVGRLDPLLMQLPDLDLWVRLCSAYEIHVLAEALTAFRILDRERNTSAPSRERLARCAWEMPTVLRHYAALPDADLAVILPADAAAHPRRIRLALAALAVSKPGYACFGLELLRACLREDPAAFPYREYFRLVGSADPLGAELWQRDHQLLKRSRVVALIRRGLRWWRSRNFGR
jgi:glycosyltransferase involved in cell wall biosynthesis